MQLAFSLFTPRLIGRRFLNSIRILCCSWHSKSHNTNDTLCHRFIHRKRITMNIWIIHHCSLLPMLNVFVLFLFSQYLMYCSFSCSRLMIHTVLFSLNFISKSWQIYICLHNIHYLGKNARTLLYQQTACYLIELENLLYVQPQDWNNHIHFR